MNREIHFDIPMEESPWTLKIVSMGDGCVSFNLHWKVKYTPNHSVVISLEDFERMVKDIIENDHTNRNT